MSDKDHTPYPQEFPLDCIKTLIDLIRSGKAADNIPVVAKEAYTIVGYVLGVVVGEPGTDPVTPPTLLFGTPEEENEKAVAVTELVSLLSDQPMVVSGTISNIILAKLLEQLFQLLLEKLPGWLDEWLNKDKDEPNAE